MILGKESLEEQVTSASDDNEGVHIGGEKKSMAS